MGPLTFQAIIYVFQLYLHIKVRNIPKIYLCNLCADYFNYTFDLMVIPFNELNMFTFYSSKGLFNHLLTYHFVYESKEHIEDNTKFCFRSYIKSKWEEYYVEEPRLFWSPERIQRYILLHDYLKKENQDLADEPNSEGESEEDEYIWIENTSQDKRYITEL